MDTTTFNMGYDYAYGIGDNLPYTKPNRANRHRAYALSCGTIKKKTPFGRLLGGKFDEAGNKITLRHSTRGTVVRQLTDTLMNQLAG